MLLMSDARLSNIHKGCLSVAALCGRPLLRNFLGRGIPLPIQSEYRAALWINAIESQNPNGKIQSYGGDLTAKDKHGWTQHNATRSCGPSQWADIPLGDYSSILKPSTQAEVRNNSLHVCGLELTYLGE